MIFHSTSLPIPSAWRLLHKFTTSLRYIIIPGKVVKPPYEFSTIKYPEPVLKETLKMVFVKRPIGFFVVGVYFSGIFCQALLRELLVKEVALFPALIELVERFFAKAIFLVMQTSTIFGTAESFSSLHFSDCYKEPLLLWQKSNFPRNAVFSFFGRLQPRSSVGNTDIFFVLSFFRCFCNNV
jgi:hypothetical protein